MRYRLICLLLLATAILVVTGIGCTTTPEKDDMAVIRERMLEPLTRVPEIARVDKLRKSLQPDGHWEDVNYEGTSTTSWEPAQHLQRLLIIVQAWFAPDSPMHGEPALGEQISTALDYWLNRDPRRRWWWDAIGAPGILSQIMLMCDGYLTDYQMTKGVQILERAELGATGQNLVWQAEITARRAVLQRDGKLLCKAFELIASEIHISDGEGIQADFSFHQHGQVLYNHGYGAGFATDNARLARLTAGTAFEYPPDKIELLSHYILDGSQWMTHNKQVDFGAQGREISRQRSHTSSYLGQAAEAMLSLPTGRHKEFKALVDRAAGNPAPPLIGNRHFFRSDIMVHHRKDWYVSARMYSTRTYNTDGLSGTFDGLLSHYLAEGTTCIMQHGNEYAGIYPLWDWQRIPGTTVELAKQVPGEPKRKGESEFAGGVSDGTFGVAAFNLKREALSAKKSWFFFSDMVICLGTGINCDTKNDVVTTVNQCRLSGTVSMSEGNSSETFKKRRAKMDIEWLHHDGIGYLFPEMNRVELVTETRTESWKRISSLRPDHKVTDSVFMLTILHGAKPTEKEYTYAVFPGKEASKMPDIARRMPFNIFANSSEKQAVWCESDETMGIVFYKPGKIKAAGWEVTSDRACVLLLRRADGLWTLSAADPTAGTGTLNLTVELNSEAPRNLKLSLPEGMMAGSSVSTKLYAE